MSISTAIALAILGPIILKIILWANVTLFFNLMNRRLESRFLSFTLVEFALSFAMSLSFMLSIQMKTHAPPYLPTLFMLSGIGWLIYSAHRAWRQSRPL